MSVPCSSLVLTPTQRRQLAAVVLRGGVDAYDRSPALQHVLDSLINDLVLHALVDEPAARPDAIVDRLLQRYAYRLPALRVCQHAA